MLKKSPGFMLIELLCVLAIISILTLLGSGCLAPFLQQQHIRAQINELQHLLQLGKIRAITHQHYVILCPRTPNNQCGHNWQQGMILFEDLNHNHQRDPNEPLLFVLPPAVFIWEIKHFPRYDWLQWDPYGTQGSNGHIALLDHKGTERVRITFNQAGRIR